MATKERKKNRRSNRAGGRPSNYSQLYKDDNSKVDAVPATPSSLAEIGAGVKKGSEAVDWTSEYTYVIGDLRTLLAVSALIFVVMIGAGFLF